MSAPTLATRVLTCTECADAFAWDSSPDVDRCQTCAEVHEWFEALRPLARREQKEA